MMESEYYHPEGWFKEFDFEHNCEFFTFLQKQNKLTEKRFRKLLDSKATKISNNSLFQNFVEFLIDLENGIQLTYNIIFNDSNSLQFSYFSCCCLERI